MEKMKKESTVLALRAFKVNAYDKEMNLNVYEERPGSWTVSLGNVLIMSIPTEAVYYVTHFAMNVGTKLTDGEMYGFKLASLSDRAKEERKFCIDIDRKELDEAGFGYE